MDSHLGIDLWNFNDPSFWQIVGFIIVGIGGPVGSWIARSGNN